MHASSVVTHRREILKPRLFLALCSAFLGTIVLLASYGDVSVFSSGWKATLAEVLGYVAVHGPVASTALFIVLLPYCYVGMLILNRLETKHVIWSYAVGGILALTTTFTPYGTGESEASTISTFGYVPPVVPDDMRTKFYIMYMLIRWCGYTLLFSFAVAMIVACVLRRAGAKSDIGHRGLPPLLSCEVKQAIRARVRGFWSRISALRWLFEAFTPIRCIAVAGIILLLWVPWIIMLSPANIGADTVAQLVWYRTGKAWDPSLRVDLPGYAMSDHHPWLDTLIYGWFDSIGLAIGNETFGIWLLSFAHSFALALALGTSLCYIGARLKINWKWCTTLTAFYALVPLFGRLSMTVVKDLTSLPFFIFWVVMFIEYVIRARSHRRIGPVFWIGFLLLAVMCMETRKIAVYIILASLLVLLIFVRKRLMTLSFMVIIVALMSIIPAVVFPALHVAPGGTQEMLSIPLQQTFAVYEQHGDTMSADDKAIIEDSLECSIDQIREEYDEYQANPVKDCFKRDISKQQIARLLWLWVRQGVAHPLTYMKSVDWLRDYFVVGSVYDQGFFVRWGWEANGGNDILPQYESWEMSSEQEFGQAIYQTASQLPVVGLLMTEAVYLSWIPLMSFALCIILGRKKNILYMTPLLFSIAAVLTTPIHNVRYGWTLPFCVALMVVIPFIDHKVDSTGLPEGKRNHQQSRLQDSIERNQQA
ncbi:MAG: DUF6020 family protein [Bifidobacterium crudilactis]|jgi:hypothetical protein|nr:DUF6020 family protein [Bifidobacterium crudilactis]